MNASREHLLAPGDIPVVQIDRGGQVTYHGPGQLVIYPLINLRRRRLGVRELVVALENAVIGYAAELGVTAQDRGARRRACTSRAPNSRASVCAFAAARAITALALNVALDLEPFERINVCGHRGLAGDAAGRSRRRALPAPAPPAPWRPLPED